MLKALIIGWLFGIRSERQLEREISFNVGYRWLLRFRLIDGVFYASTLSQNRRWFTHPSVAEDIFDAIVEQPIGHGLLDGTVLYTNSTHLQASADKVKSDLALMVKSRPDYWADLDRVIDAERVALGQKWLKDKDRGPGVKQTKVSRTYPEAGYMVRESTAKGVFYLDHGTVDYSLCIITDAPCHVSHCACIDLLSGTVRLCRRAGFGIARGLEERAIIGGNRLSASNAATAGHAKQVALSV